MLSDPLHPDFLSFSRVLGQRLAVIDESVLTVGDIQVTHPDGPVAVLERKARYPYVGRTRRATWHIDPVGPAFYLDEPRGDSALVPPHGGRFEPRAYVFCDDGTDLRWKVTSFWKSRYGFCDDNDRCRIEITDRSLWVYGDDADWLYLAPLVFIAIISIKTHPR